MTPGTLALILLSVTLSACAQVLFKLGVAPVPSAGGHPSPVSAVLATLHRPGVLGGVGGAPASPGPSLAARPLPRVVARGPGEHGGAHRLPIGPE